MYVKSQNHEPGEGDAQAQHSSTAQQETVVKLAGENVKRSSRGAH